MLRLSCHLPRLFQSALEQYWREVVDGFFFAIITKMKMILQSVVRLIIIGSLSELVVCNRQFYSVPPLPYYQNDGYYYSDIPSYGEPSPYYYNSHNVPPHPTPYTNYYVPPQLFQQNENYRPPQGIYPHVPPNEMNFIPSMAPPQGMNVDYPMMSSNPTFGTKDGLHNHRPPHVPQQDTKFYNIIEKEKDFQPYYHDDYNKNYHEDDYDNYNDDDQGDPCVVTYPYHYFEASRKNPNMYDGNNLKKYSPCYPHFQPDFRDKIYSFKAPITILPSRFPPRIEEIIERIQNYFSTYTQQGMQGAQKPLNSSSSSSSTSSSVSSSSSSSSSSATDVPSTMMTNSESEAAITSPATDHQQHHHDKSKTGENDHSISKVGTPLFNSADIKLEHSETTVNAVSDVERVTEKAEVLTTHLDNGLVSTTEETHNAETSQVHEHHSQSPSLVMEEIADATETVPDFSNQPEEEGQHDAQMTSTEVQNHLTQETSTSESLIQHSVKEMERTLDKATESSHSSESKTVPLISVSVEVTTEPTEHELRTEEHDFLTTTNEVFTTEKS